MAEKAESQLFDDSKLPDLVRDARLTTTDRAGEVVHTIYSSTLEQPRPVLVEQSWKREKRLGFGSFGFVWLESCTSTSPGKIKGQRAVKEIPKERGMLPTLRQFTHELETIFKFSHDRYLTWFTRSYGWWETPNAIFIAMEFAKYGNLSNHLGKPFSELVSCDICKQVLNGLRWMHAQQFAHRDLEPQNILVFQRSPTWWVKLSDFGISKRLQEQTEFRTRVGTLAYMAPEIRGMYAPSDDSSDDDEEQVYTFAVDMWSLGQLTSQMITGGLLFQDGRELYGYVVRGKPFPLRNLQDHDASEFCCDFIEKVMLPSPSVRMTAEQALEHAWTEAKGNQLMTQDDVSDISEQIDAELTLKSEASASWTTLDPRVSDVDQGTETHSTLGSVESASLSTTSSRQIESFQTGESLPQFIRYSQFQPIQQLQAPPFKKICSVAFSPNGLQIVTVTTDSDSIYPWTIDLWGDNSQGQLHGIQTLAHNEFQAVETIVFSPNNQWIVAVSWERAVCIWKRSHNEWFEPVSHDIERFFSEDYGQRSQEIAFAPDSQQFATYGNHHRSAHIIERDSRGKWRVVQTLGWGSVLFSFTFSPSGQLFAAGDSTSFWGSLRGSICTWKKENGGTFRQLQRIAVPGEYFSMDNSVRFSWDERLIYVRYEQDVLLFEWNLEGQLQQTRQLETNTHRVTSIFCFPDNQSYISVSFGDKSIQVWKSDEEGRVKVTDKLEGPNEVLDFSWDGQWLVTRSSPEEGQSLHSAEIIVWKWQVI